MLAAQRRDAAALLLAGLSASMSILGLIAFERLFEAKSVLGTGVSDE